MLCDLMLALTLNMTFLLFELSCEVGLKLGETMQVTF